MPKRRESYLKIFFAIAVSVFIFAWVMTSFYQNNKKEVLKRNEEFLVRMTSQQSNHIVWTMEDAMAYVKGVGNIFNRTSLEDKKHMKDILKEIEKKSPFDRLSICYDDGECYRSTGDNLNVKDRAYYKDGMAGNSGISSVIDSRFNKKETVLCYYPVCIDGKVKAVVLGVFYMETIEKLLDDNSNNMQVKSSIVSKNGTVLCSNGDMPEKYQKVKLNKEKDTQYYKESNEKMIMVSYQNMGINDWYVVQEIPQEATIDMIDSLNYSAWILVMKLTAVFVLLLCTVLYWNRQRKEELDIENQRLNSMISHIPGIVCEYWVDTKMIQIYGEIQNEISFGKKQMSVKEMMSFIHPDDKKKIHDIYQKIIIENHMYMELRVQNKHGEYQWNSLMLNVIKDWNQRVRAVIFVFRNIEKYKKEIISLEKENRAFEEAIQLLGNSYFKIISVNLENRNCKILKAFDETPEKIAIYEKDFEIWVRDTAYQKVCTEDRLLFMSQLSWDVLVRRFQKGEKSISFIYRRFVNDKLVWVEAELIYTRDQNDDYEKFMVYIKNINQAKIAEEQHKKELKGALQEANKANQVKSDFIDYMSHDLRTPMNAIVGMNQLAISELKNCHLEKAQYYLQNVEQVSNYLRAVVNDILEISYFKNHVPPMIPKNFEMGTLREVCRQYVNYLQEENKVQYEDFVDEECAAIYQGDVARLQQVLFNLLSNAVKFNQQDGKVVLEILVHEKTQQGDWLEFIVCDSGIGMEQEFLAQVFEPFSKVAELTSETMSGGGLGLTIVKKVINAMGGTLEIQSSPGCGTKVSCRVFLLYGKEEEPESEGGEIKRTVLLAEDNELNLEIAQALLELKGYDVITAKDGEEAVKMFRDSAEGQIQIFLTDIHMPKMNGRDAAKTIRKMERQDTKELVIGALTANALLTTVADDAKAEFDFCLQKPFDVEEFHKIIMEHYKK